MQQQQEQGEFSEWLHALRSQQTSTAAASHMSDSSSWADTDSESDSESEAHFTFGDHKSSKSSKMVPSYERTAPMLIPQASRPRRRSYYMNEFEDSLPSHHNNQHTSSSAALYESSSYYGESVEDEDDPTLYQNLAYFRSQNKTSSSHRKQQQFSVRSRSPVSSTASDSDDIFDMEL